MNICPTTIRSRTRKRPLIVAVHGILTRNTGPSWPWHFAALAAQRFPGSVTIPLSYTAGPFPWWNMTFENPHAANALCATVKNFSPSDFILHFVAHSNGVPVTAMAMPLLLKAGYELGGALMVAGAMPRDISTSALDGIVRFDLCRRVVALASTGDHALELAEHTSYGPAVGRHGFYRNDDRVVADRRLQTIFLNHMDHSDYWAEDHFETTARIFADAAGLAWK